MKRVALVAVVALTLGLVGVGHAADIASCHGTSTVNLDKPGNSFMHDCTVTFAVTAETAVTGTLLPGPLFTGSLEMFLQKIPGEPGATYGASAFFVLAQPLENGSLTATLSPGTWRMIVHARGFGDYSGVLTDGTTPTPPGPLPSDLPTAAPSDVPTVAPSDLPTALPSDLPTALPSDLPTTLPSP